MKKIATLLVTTAICACTKPAAPVQAAPDQIPTCPKVTANTPWNLAAKRGIDFWTCDYAFAVSDKPLFSVLVSNHVGTAPLTFYTVYPEAAQLAWFREISNGKRKIASYWAFKATDSRVMGVAAINIKAADSAEFRQKAAIAATLEQ